MSTNSLALNQLVCGFSIATAQFQQGLACSEIFSGIHPFLPENGTDADLSHAVEPLRRLHELELAPHLLAVAFFESAQRLHQITRETDPQVSLWAESVRQVWKRGLSYPPLQAETSAALAPSPEDDAYLVEGLRRFVEFSPEPMGVVKCHADGSAEMVLFNRKNRERWGLDEKDLVGVGVLRFFYPEDHDTVRGFIQECLQTGNATRTGVRMLRSSGGHLLVDMYVGLVPDTHYAYFQVINETQREQAIEQVRIREAVLRNAQKPLLMLSFDEDGTPSGMLTSAGFNQLLGYKPDEIGNKPVIDFIPKHLRDAFSSRLRKFLTTGTLKWEAAELVRKDGSTVLVDIEANDSGVKGERYAIASFGDTQARIAAEHDASEAQKLDIIASVSAGIAHDANNIATILMGGLDLLRMKYPDDEFLPTMIDKVGMMSGMFNRFRRLTDTVEREGGIDLHSILSESDIRLATPSSKDFDIQFDLAEDPWTVAGPNFAVWQIVFNVIKNALEAMEKSPVRRLTLRTENIQILTQQILRRLDPENRFPETRPGDYLRLTIEDTGSGIPSDNLSRIFQDYFSTKDGVDANRGRGLSTSQLAIAKRGGLLTVRSELGHGTTFDIYLPRTESRTPTPPPTVTASILPDERLVSPGREVILVADDDEGIRNQFQRVLQFFRYQEVLFAGTTNQVLEIVRRRQGDLTAVIMDWRMPGITASELLRELSDVNPRLPILVNTGLIPEHKNPYPNVQFIKKMTGASRVGLALRRLIKGERIE